MHCETSRRELIAKGAALGLSGLLCATGAAQTEPKRQTWAAPDSDSPGYEQVRTLAAALGAERVRIDPSVSHTNRFRMLREGRAQFAATSVAGSFFAQEGLFSYAAKEWGPQPVRLVLTNMQAQLFGIVAANDAGIASVSDLKGKRIASVKGASEMHQHLSALLAHAGLAWTDIKVVTVHGYREAIESIIANRADAAFAVSSSPELQKLAKSPRGLAWPLVAHADHSAWERLREFAPYLLPVDATVGEGLSDKQPVESVNWPYPVLVALARRPVNEVYETARELVVRFRSYRDQVPGNAGWEAKRQPFSWAIPWHEGAIKVFTEQGLWSAAHQSHNDALVRRQRVLREAWDTLRRDALVKPEDEQPDEAAWLRGRALALERAGLSVLVTGQPGQ